MDLRKVTVYEYYYQGDERREEDGEMFICRLCGREFRK
jgi:hypothetical protein